ncbi:MAG: DUF58 domain-containing protein [Candidatus Cloacimonetes bacterium]|jgi:uncharacterized protein (DUF58 family)|nr:DUF58 domain-containing protein [Candidatus Cloacimonadota bacterium]MBT6994890.1 DUF58 domain-containing protein [Candidatus Cloacimonadota bacterium]MBT7468835.1 DUF58 domain-containing protein [Candidatus Cloacimonadota bacterium]
MPKSYLSEEFVATIDKFNLRAKLIVEGFIVGLHKSPYHGFSVEFSDHRQYIPGDAIRNIDWKVYAKTNRYYIKRYEEETNLKSYILVDHSASMGYASNKTSKLEYAKTFASALAYLMLSQQDAVGLLSYTNKITNYLPPRSMKSYLNVIFKELHNLQPTETTQTAEVLHSLADRIKKRGLIILISDMLDDPDKILQGLQHFRHQKHEVILFHIQDKQEMNFDFKNETEFVDSETGEKITVNPWQIKKDYLATLEKNTTYLKTKCHTSFIEYNPITTATPFEDNLLQYLIKRMKLG